MIVVAGDPTVDWMMTRAESSVAVTYSYDVSSSVAVTAGAGGAALLQHLTRAIVKAGDLSINVSGVEVPQEAIDLPHFSDVARTYTVWQLLPKSVGSQDRV